MGSCPFAALGEVHLSSSPTDCHCLLGHRGCLAGPRGTADGLEDHPSRQISHSPKGKTQEIIKGNCCFHLFGATEPARKLTRPWSVQQLRVSLLSGELHCAHHPSLGQPKSSAELDPRCPWVAEAPSLPHTHRWKGFLALNLHSFHRFSTISPFPFSPSSWLRWGLKSLFTAGSSSTTSLKCWTASLSSCRSSLTSSSSFGSTSLKLWGSWFCCGCGVWPGSSTVRGTGWVCCPSLSYLACSFPSQRKSTGSCSLTKLSLAGVWPLQGCDLSGAKATHCLCGCDASVTGTQQHVLLQATRALFLHHSLLKGCVTHGVVCIAGSSWQCFSREQGELHQHGFDGSVALLRLRHPPPGCCREHLDLPLDFSHWEAKDLL